MTAKHENSNKNDLYLNKYTNKSWNNLADAVLVQFFELQIRKDLW